MDDELDIGEDEVEKENDFDLVGGGWEADLSPKINEKEWSTPPEKKGDLDFANLISNQAPTAQVQEQAWDGDIDISFE